MNDTRLTGAQRSKLRQSVGGLMREARKERGYSLDTLSEMTGIGKSQLSRMETGHIMPTLYTLTPWCHALGISVASLCQDLGL